MENNLQFLTPIIANLVRYFLFAGLAFAVFYKMFPGFFSKNKIQERSAKKKDFWREILHSTQSSIIIGLVIAAFVYTPLREYAAIYKDIAAYPLWWIPVSVVLALVIHDSYFYWMHRIVHHPKVYKTVHLVHHKSVNPSPWASYSFHFTEAAMEAMVVPFIIYLVPMHPIALLLFGLSAFAINVYGHLGFELAPKWFRHSFLFEIMNTSVHHNLHHEKVKGNYGLYFRVWDRIMETEQAGYVEKYDRIQERRFGKTKPVSVAKKAAAVVIVLLLSTGAYTLSAQSGIVGEWHDPANGATVLIFEQDGKYFGELITADDPEENAELQAVRKEQQVFVLTDFETQNGEKFCCGTIFHARRRVELDGELTLIDASTLKVKGSYGFLSGSKIWTRV